MYGAVVAQKKDHHEGLGFPFVAVLGPVVSAVAGKFLGPKGPSEEERMLALQAQIEQQKKERFQYVLLAAGGILLTFIFIASD